MESGYQGTVGSQGGGAYYGDQRFVDVKHVEFGGNLADLSTDVETERQWNDRAVGLDWPDPTYLDQAT